MSDRKYCTVEDVFGVVPASVLMRVALAVASASTTANTLTINGHGLAEDAPFDIVLQSGGTVAAPLAVGTTYYADPVSDVALRVRAEPGGDPIDLTTAGSGMMLRPSCRPGIEERIVEYSRWVEDRLPAHAVPLELESNGRYHPTVRGMVALLAAEAALEDSGKTSESVTRRADRTRRDAELRLRGLPMRNAPAASPSNLAMGASPSVTRTREDIL
jgi:hypothetical protein